VSKYFQVLERLERGRAEPAAARVDVAIAPAETVERALPRLGPRPARLAPRPLVEPGVQPDAPEAPEPPAVTEIEPRRPPRVEPFEFLGPPAPLSGVDGVFHNIEVLTRGRRPMSLVFAGASATDWVDVVVKSFTEYAEGKGERVLVAELSDSGGDRTLLCRRPAAAAADDEPVESPPVQIDLRGGASRETLVRWREEVAPGCDITLLIGPPLAGSVDAALLASLCDGLVLVVVHQETHRGALALASERARVSRCPTVAVVVNGSRDKPPSWLRRILER
jgi:hypothetical protein